ncbi:MAG TPA: ABC transporter ATP-binding protein [Acidimicrobiales bacterium]|nr:ABC transporter ATP-binding protein [Acidimicrobiales bacterium]
MRQLGAFALDARLTVAAGEVVALVGPNGSGKSTLLQAVVEDNPGVGLVFQDRLLFPHLNAVDNVAFGLRRQGMRAGAARAEARRWLERFGVADYAERTPDALSGGQAQRVALARALAPRPGVLLLDEPFAAVDLHGRAEVRRALRAALAEHAGACVLVTHQPIDVLALAGRVVVLEEGRVVQDGSVEEVRSRPRTPWVAEMAGVNLLEGTAGPDGIDIGPAVVSASSFVRGPAFAVIHPNSVTLSTRPPQSSARNVWTGRVAEIDPEGDRARVRVTGAVDLVAEVTAAAVRDLGLSPGVEVWAAVKATEVEVYPA